MTATPINLAIQDMVKKVNFTDDRQQSKVKYPLIPSIFCIILAWIGGNNSAVSVADYIEENFTTLGLLIPNIGEKPMSHDTILRLIKTVKFPEIQQFVLEFCSKVQAYASDGQPSFKVLSMDGQTPRGIVYEKEGDQKSPQDRREYNHQYYVSLYDSTNKLTIAQEDVYDKENENKACIRLCELLSLSGAVVTSDALNCTRKVAEAIIANDGDYCLAVKSNKGKLFDEMKRVFNDPEILDDISITACSEPEKAHGRVEIRYVTALPANIIKPRILGEWAKYTGTIFFARTYSYNTKYDTYREPECRYFISSLSFDDPRIAEYGLDVIRGHWGIEAHHHILDVTYQQDMMFAKNRNFVRNALYLNKIALNCASYAKDHLPECKSKSIKRIKDTAGRSPYKAAQFLCSFFNSNTICF